MSFAASPPRVAVLITTMLLPLFVSLTCLPFAYAYSSSREHPLSYLSPVLNISINTPDHKVTPDSFFSLTIEVPNSENYNNINRRWVALSDPNASKKIKSLASYFPFLRQQLVLDSKDSQAPNKFRFRKSKNSTFFESGTSDGSDDNDTDTYSANDLLGQFTWADGSPVKQDSYYSASLTSEKLLYYLAKNNSLSGIEYPQDTQVFKITLQPNVELSDTSSNVYTINEQGDMVPHPDFTSDGFGKRDQDNRVKIFKGLAYREVVSLNPATGYMMKSYKRVGWARFLVSRDGDHPLVDGTWKVDDEEGLGVPAALYKVSTKDNFLALLNTPTSSESERAILNKERKLLTELESQFGDHHTQMIVWRDADMHPTIHQNLNVLDDNYDRKGVSLLESWFDSNKLNLLKRADGSLFEGNETTDPDYLFKYQMRFFTQTANDQGYPVLVSRSGDTNDTGGSGFSSGLNLASTVGDTSGCPKRRMIALVGIAADCNLVSAFNTTSATREWLVNMVNSASQVYERQLNITLGISALVLVNETTCPSSPVSSSSTPWSYSCDYNPSTAMNDRLGSFSSWRGTRAGDNIATWTLLTTCTQSAVVGLSWMGLLCSPGSSGNSVAGTNVVARTSYDWRVYAHEVGHTFGAVHDCTSDTCTQNLQASSQCCVLSRSTCDANGGFIMNPASGASQDSFSDCTVGNICGAIGRNSINSTCLTSNTGVKLVTSNECGNGIVEEGEECDCGGPEGCAGNSCCDPTTCKFKNGAQCDDTNEECCSGCKFASSDTVCRQSTGPCDYAINCPGDSSVCPPARYKPNGDSCTLPNSTFNNLKCVSGHCTSRDLQCVQLLSNTTLVLHGTVVNVTRSCSDDSYCQLSCMDPRMGDVCIRTSLNFLDGTPCGGSGTCSMGRCIGGRSTNGFLGDAQSWIDRNTGTLIAIIVSIAGFIVVMVLAGLTRRIWYRYRNRQMISQRPKPQGPYNVPPPYAQAGVYSQRSMHPPPPPPPQAYSSPGWGNSNGPGTAAAASPYGREYSNLNYGGNNPAGYYSNGQQNGSYYSGQAPSGPPQYNNSYEMSTFNDGRPARPAQGEYTNPFINPGGSYGYNSNHYR